MLVRMCLARIVIVDTDEDKMAMIVLREVDGKNRAFPIMIGIPEALAIDRRTKNEAPARPMTHDLIEHLFEALDCQLEQIVITELRKSTFYAKLVLRRTGELLEIDSRPSDAMAIGAGTEAPIFVEEAVLKEVCQS